ncbi:PorP/SprF family type IX secretion system membrane protein [Pedobacter sp. KLB.chiD]|uniref:PorP/SprF family type IX secretion system membrane protein n=1 Tax=Pedobacter sp. KLB.chiD TaxID=3387402 RepID=UPI003999C790
MKTLKIILMLCSIQTLAFSQLNPSATIYYLNPYLANPAYAGNQLGWQANLSYKAQWTAIPQAPSQQYLSCTYGTSRKIGLGLNLFRETYGVFDRTNIKLSYAYQLPLDDEETFLDFGISGSVKNNSINYKKVIAEEGDQTLLNYNNRRWSADGDAGLVVRNALYKFAVSISDVRGYIRNQTEPYADRPGLLMSVQGNFENYNVVFTPLIMYSQVRNFRDIYHIGLQGNTDNGKFNAGVIYHSTKSITFSIGTQYMDRLGISAFYTSGTSTFKEYSNGEFEFALKLKW